LIAPRALDLDRSKKFLLEEILPIAASPIAASRIPVMRILASATASVDAMTRRKLRCATPSKVSAA
jgi:hypothetical protein